jgi:serine/threonine protein phosphatase PrpC
LQKTPDDPAVVASRLLVHSLEKGSKDNHSAMIVQFKSGEVVAGPVRPYQNDQKFVEAYFAVRSVSCDAS